MFDRRCTCVGREGRGGGTGLVSQQSTSLAGGASQPERNKAGTEERDDDASEGRSVSLPLLSRVEEAETVYLVAPSAEEADNGPTGGGRELATLAGRGAGAQGTAGAGAGLDGEDARAVVALALAQRGGGPALVGREDELGGCTAGAARARTVPSARVTLTASRRAPPRKARRVARGVEGRAASTAAPDDQSPCVPSGHRPPCRRRCGSCTRRLRRRPARRRRSRRAASA
ncbi:uncharacterized protein VDAG_03833 [Verticillium dahliae VdLs.17]|uniref:Uncharacterized protein n=1 Tax=Verticillium dahliae (strain VdLs.17 / ATCC MYA-4575 / FGSC 10137) TaxID=498257 RepID=G2X0Q4_VERDV|nr:uncharacterized protein VDAG_03833 [Verticillium dahliae VdLs.17]EGY22395.1 hypothetical protein VDAG_03833 [Verticillium dahliae VdLs.17]